MFCGLYTCFVFVCFLDFQCVCVASVAQRLPAAYRSGTWSGKGRRVGWGDWKGQGTWKE